MRRRIGTLDALAGAMAALGVAAMVPSLGAQQQVQVIVTAVPNPVPAGSCTGIWVEVRNAANQRLNDLNGVPLHSRSYDYSIPSTPGFAWRDNDPTSGYLCAQAGVAMVNIPVTATVRSTTYSGATIVTIQSGAPPQVGTANPQTGTGNPNGAAGGAAQPGYGQPAGAAGAAAGGAARPGYGHRLAADLSGLYYQ